MLNNIIAFEDDVEATPNKMEKVTLEIERFANSIEIEMSSSGGDNCRMALNLEDGKKLADFLGAWIGLLSA